MLTREHLRHVGVMLGVGRRGAAAVYDSLGSDPWAALSPGWLNVGWWETTGDADEAAVAPRRLVERIAAPLPTGGTIVDVGNGLAVQDPVIAAVAQPRRFAAVNITESQLRAGRERLAEAGASPVVGDATRLPFADGSIDGVISVEAGFHFRTREDFLREARRVLRPGGVLTTSDVTMEYRPNRPIEVAGGLMNLRFWAVPTANLVSARELERLVRDSGFTDVEVERCGAQTIDPFVRFSRKRFRSLSGVNRFEQVGARAIVWTWEVLRRRGALDYVLLRATAA